MKIVAKILGGSVLALSLASPASAWWGNNNWSGPWNGGNNNSWGGGAPWNPGSWGNGPWNGGNNNSWGGGAPWNWGSPGGFNFSPNWSSNNGPGFGYGNGNSYGYGYAPSYGAGNYYAPYGYSQPQQYYGQYPAQQPAAPVYPQAGGADAAVEANPQSGGTVVAPSTQ